MGGRALVTGATGLLGSHVAGVLLEGGWSVRALVRSPARAGALRAAGVEPVEGSLEDAEALEAAARGCDAVFHAAALIGTRGDWAAYRAANVLGTERVVAAAARAGARLVHVSSTAVHGRARYREGGTTEDDPLPELSARDLYGRSKQEAEAVALEAHRAGRAWVSVVRPPVMYGPGDRQFLPRVGPVLERGFFPTFGGGTARMALVHARHVAEGAVLAATRDAAGGRVYLLTDDFPVTVADVVRCAEAGLGRRILSPDVPLPVARAGLRGLRAVLRLAGRPDLGRYAKGALEMLTKDNPFSSARARRELGWTPTVHPDVGLTEAFRSWKAERAASSPSGP